MTEMTPVDEGAPEILISEAMALYADAARAFRQAIEAAREGGAGAARETQTGAKELRAALQIVFQERAIVDKLRRQNVGGGGAGALDLDAARDEIGRRLARLRDAGECGGVP